jgi:hypothetical protein
MVNPSALAHIPCGHRRGSTAVARGSQCQTGHGQRPPHRIPWAAELLTIRAHVRLSGNREAVEEPEPPPGFCTLTVRTPAPGVRHRRSGLLSLPLCSEILIDPVPSSESILLRA